MKNSAKNYARWIEDGYTNYPCVCSYCGFEAPYNKDTKEYDKSSKCPDCGAIMDVIICIDVDNAIAELKAEQHSNSTREDYDKGYWNALTMAQAILLNMKKNSGIEVNVNAINYSSKEE
jgi:hypothetical protein